MTDTLALRSQGGRTRAARLSPERRRAIAQAGGKAKAAKPAPPADRDMVEASRTALTLLQSIRSQFRGWGCDRTADRLDAAISSAKGAVRNIENRADRGA